MSQSFDAKEQLVEDFIKTISYIDDKPFDEIENEIQAIVYKTRGVIYQSLYTPKTFINFLNRFQGIFQNLVRDSILSATQVFLVF